jgi:hypothetical protein
VNYTEPIASLDANLVTDALGGGEHLVSIRARDSRGHWGPYATAVLKLDKEGPTTLSVNVDPKIPYNPSVFAMRVDATLEDLSPTLGVTSTIQWAEGYIICDSDTTPEECRHRLPPLPGEGFPLSPRDGMFDTSLEEAYAYIPMPTVNALGAGDHEIWVRAQDASGNWGAAVAGSLVIN